MSPRSRLASASLPALLLLAACRREESGPISISAIGGAPRLINPTREAPDAPSALLLEATAQGLVRFDSAGEIEPALAQRWTVSDDGLHYTFRLARLTWRNGSAVKADQVVARLRAAASPSSRNPLKPVLGAIDDIVTMTDEVLEISLKSPRLNFLQLLAQPEMAVIRGGEGSGPYRAAPRPDGSLLLTPPPEDEEDSPQRANPPIQLRGERSAVAVARFKAGAADLVIGGTLADLPIANASAPRGDALVFDPALGMFGLAFTAADGPFATAESRQALAMAIDRGALVTALRVPALRPAASLLPPGTEGIATGLVPAWTASPLAARRERASEVLARLAKGTRLNVRVAMPQGPGFRILYAALRRDWASVGVAAERVGPEAPADVRLIDEVAPAALASWYLRHFTCEASRVCDPAADEAMAAARVARTPEERRAMLTNADRLLAAAGVFIPLSSPIRWSLVAPRLTGFRANAFARHSAGELIRRGP